MVAPSPGGSRSHIPWEALRDVYLERFGPLFAAELEQWFDDDLDLDLEALLEQSTSLLDEPTYFTLAFGAPDTAPRFVFATLGAAARTGGHEIFIECAVPYAALEHLLVDERITGRPVSPGTLVPVEIDGTPFEAVLFAPESAGSIPFACPDGATRFALRLIPLTGPEHKLARRSLPRLLAALQRAAAAGPVDPLRDCAVAPAKIRAAFPARRAALVDALRFHVALRLHQFRYAAALGDQADYKRSAALGLVRAHTALRAIEPAAVPPGLGPGPMTERVASHERVLRSIHEQADARIWALLDGEWRRALLETTGLVLLTHPVAQRLLVDAGAIAGELHPDADRIIEEVAEWIVRFRPRSDLEEILEAGRVAAARAARTSVLDDGQVSPSEAWKQICFGMYHCLFHPTDPRPLPPRELIETVFAGLGAAADGILLDIPEPESSIERLGQTLQIVGIVFLARRYRIPAGRDPDEGPTGRVLH